MMTMHDPLSVNLIDTHTTAVLAGIVIGGKPTPHLVRAENGTD
jgi:hypothetical protein